MNPSFEAIWRAIKKIDDAKEFKHKVLFDKSFFVQFFCRFDTERYFSSGTYMQATDFGDHATPHHHRGSRPSSSASGDLTLRLQDYHNQLDEILRHSGDEPVSYSRFQDPYLLYDSAAQKSHHKSTSTTTHRRQAVAAAILSTPTNDRDPATKTYRHRNVQTMAETGDFFDEVQGRSLRYDSMTSGSGEESVGSGDDRWRGGRREGGRKNMESVRRIRKDVLTKRSGGEVCQKKNWRSTEKRKNFRTTSYFSIKMLFFFLLITFFLNVRALEKEKPLESMKNCHTGLKLKLEDKDFWFTALLIVRLN